jgi:hypothetical protein
MASHGLQIDLTAVIFVDDCFRSRIAILTPRFGVQLKLLMRVVQARLVKVHGLVVDDCDCASFFSKVSGGSEVTRIYLNQYKHTGAVKYR